MGPGISYQVSPLEIYKVTGQWEADVRTQTHTNTHTHKHTQKERALIFHQRSVPLLAAGEGGSEVGGGLFLCRFNPLSGV